MWPVVAVPILAVLVAGCGGGSDPSASGPATSAAPASAVASPEQTDTGCTVSDAVKEQVTDSHVTKIKLIGGCTQVSIETTLNRADFLTAAKICEAAAKVAYVGNVSSVSVNGPDGHELAAGTKDQPCIGEP
jgi:hypothetical protein